MAFAFSATAVVVGGVATAALIPGHAPASPWRIAFFFALYAVVARVSFELGSGKVIPTELVLVPMLFLVPLGAVPLIVAGAMILASFADRPKALRDPLRTLPSIASAAHAFGPVLVLAIGGLPLRWEAWPWYVAALAAQFAFDFAAAAVGNLGHRISPRRLASFVVYAYAVDAAIAPVGLALAFAARNNWYVAALGLPLVAVLRTFARERRLRLDNAMELGDAYRGTAFLLGDVVEADDAYTGTHSRHVVTLVNGVSERLGLSSTERREAELTALLHDVGKIRIPKDVLNKPGPLTADERALMETHAVEGERMLSQVGGLLGQVGHIVRSCHERWDGAGYPDGLAGEQIPLVSRIVSVCDAYSAMTTDRPYRAALSEREASAELAQCAGTQFDPRVVEALRDVFSAGG